MVLLLNILLAILALQTGGVESGWRSIKPLSTDKATVDKLMGSGEVDDNGYVTYQHGEEWIRVNYSTKPCEENRYARGIYRVPQNTVLDYIVYFKEPVKLSDLKWKSKKYYRDTSGDVIGVVTYFNGEDGVTISAEDVNGIEYVGRIAYRASRRADKSLRCGS